MDLVIRLRNQKSVAMFEWGVQVKFAKLLEHATAVAQCLGDGRPYVSSNSSGYIRLVLGPKPAKAHLRKKYNDDYERARATEPWLLATSLENDAAQTIVQPDAQRMKIEEASHFSQRWSTFRAGHHLAIAHRLEAARLTQTARRPQVEPLISLSGALTAREAEPTAGRFGSYPEPQHWTPPVASAAQD